MSTSLRSLTQKLPLGLTLPLALVVLTCNSLADHFDAPLGVLLTPVTVPLVVWLVAFSRNRRPVLKAVVAAALISLHDISIKLYGGGAHDLEGQGFIHMFLLFALFPSFLILVAAIDQEKNTNPGARRIAKIVFVALLAIHLTAANNLGIGRCVNCY